MAEPVMWESFPCYEVVVQCSKQKHFNKKLANVAFVTPTGITNVSIWFLARCKHTTGNMITSSNGNILHVTGPLCGEFPSQKPVTRSFEVFFDLRLNKRLSNQSWGWWFETPPRSLWRHRNKICICTYQTCQVYQRSVYDINIHQIFMKCLEWRVIVSRKIHNSRKFLFFLVNNVAMSVRIFYKYPALA